MVVPSSDHGAGDRRAYPPEWGDIWARLTPREKEVAELTAQGYPQKQIAKELGITRNTVKDHREAIVNKIPGEGRAGSKIQRLYAFICGASTEGVNP